MALLTNPETIPRKTICFFFIVENSTAMYGAKLKAINTALENFIAILQYYAAAKAEVEIKIALLTFANEAKWVTERPVAAESYIWSPIPKSENDVLKNVSFGSMFSELNHKLSKNVFMDSKSGALPPVIIIFSTSPCSEDETFLNESLSCLTKNNWDKNALKLSFTIGKNISHELLEKWTGCAGLILSVKNPQMLLDYAAVAGRICIEIATESGFYYYINKNENNIPNRRMELKNSLEKILFPGVAAEKIGQTEQITTVPYHEPVPDEDVLSELEKLSAKALIYKTVITKNYVSLNPSHIDERIGGSKFYITRKYDGVLAILSWDGNSLIAVNSTGKPYKNLLCFDEAASLLKTKGIKNLSFAAELYVDESSGRSRVSDCLFALAGDGKSLRLAPFDIIYPEHKFVLYNETYYGLKNIFEENKYCRPVRYIETNSKAEIKSIFSQWVEAEGSEGLVIRSELPFVYKVKPKISIDAAVIGFSETSDARGQVRTILYALRNDDGGFQIIGRTGNGLSTEQRSELYSRLMGMKIKSNYLEIDSNHLAFHMVRPELVIELSIIDAISENISGGIRNPLLEYSNDEIKQTGNCAGYSFMSAVIERLREDKIASIRDVSISQISTRTPIRQDNEPIQKRNMPLSQLLRREVWTKGEAVQKLLVWKTNKEQFGYPAFSTSWTSFNPNIAEPFKVDMRITNCETQINRLAEQFIAKNIKAGWVKE